MLQDSPSKSSRRLSYLLGLPMGVAAFGSSMLLEAPSAQANPYDAITLPLMTLLLSALFVAFVLKKQNFLVLEATLLTSLGLHFGGKLAYILSNQGTVSFISELSEFAYYFPALYTLAFWVFGIRRGRTLAIAYCLFTLAIGAAFHLPFVLRGEGISELYILVQFYLASGILIICLSGFAATISQQAQTTLTLEQVAHTDALTGLGNRRYLEAQLARAFAAGQTFSLVLIDIDHFKQVNDTFGHAAGDSVLRQLATLLKAGLRTGDSLGRWGGEEFMLLIPELGDGSARELCQRLKGNIEYYTFEVGAVTISSGVATFQPGDSAESLIARADAALYRAKADGRNCVVTA